MRALRKLKLLQLMHKLQHNIQWRSCLIFKPKSKRIARFAAKLRISTNVQNATRSTAESSVSKNIIKELVMKISPESKSLRSSKIKKAR